MSKTLLIAVALSLQAKFFTHEILHIIYTQEEFRLNGGYIMSVEWDAVLGWPVCEWDLQAHLIGFHIMHLKPARDYQRKH